MKKIFWVNEMENLGSALSTPYFPNEDDILTLTSGEVIDQRFQITRANSIF